MKNDSKVTLTVGQLKRLIKEAVDQEMTTDELISRLELPIKDLARRFAKQVFEQQLNIELFKDPNVLNAISDMMIEEINTQVERLTAIRDGKVIKYNDILDEIDKYDFSELSDLIDNIEENESFTPIKSYTASLKEKFKNFKNIKEIDDCFLDMAKLVVDGSTVEELRDSYGEKPCNGGWMYSL